MKSAEYLEQQAKKKSAKEASNLFHNIMKESVKGKLMSKKDKK